MRSIFKSRSPRHRATRAEPKYVGYGRTKPARPELCAPCVDKYGIDAVMSHTLTPREAVARHLFGEAVNWSSLDMADYDHSAALQADWLAEADRRIDPDYDIREWFGYTPADWDSFSVLYKVDRREEFFAVKGMAS